MRLYVNDSFFLFFVECFAFVYNRVEKGCFSVRYFGREFHSRVMCKFTRSVNLKKSTMSGLLLSHREKNVIYVAFSNSWFEDGLFQCMRP